MSVILNLPSRISNAIIFLLVDVLGLWSIHCSLKGVQSYCFNRFVRNGGTVQLVRSRIPVLSGELLQSATRTGVIFVLANAVSIVLAFLCTLEVNGKTIAVLTRLSLTNIATVDGGAALINDTSEFYSTLHSCATRNSTHFGYWPVAYSINQNYSNEEEGFITPMSPECLQGIPGFESLVMTRCIEIFEGKPCNIYDRTPMLTMNATIIQSSIKNWSALVSEFRFFGSKVQADDTGLELYSLLTARQGFTFIFHEPLEEYSHRNTAIVFLDSRVNSTWLIAYGELLNADSNFAKFQINKPAELFPSSLLPSSANFLDILRETRIFPRDRIPKTNVPALIEYLLTNSIGNQKLRQSAFSKQNKNVTVISTTGQVLFIALFSVFAVSCFTRVILIFLVTHSNNVQSHDFFVTDFDYLSKGLRRVMEKEQGMACSGGFTIMGAVNNSNASRTVGPVLSLNETL